VEVKGGEFVIFLSPKKENAMIIPFFIYFLSVSKKKNYGFFEI